MGIMPMKSIFISKKEVARMLNISPSSVTRWSKENPDFPKPFLLGPNKVVWDLREIEHYVEEQKKIRCLLLLLESIPINIFY